MIRHLAITAAGLAALSAAVAPLNAQSQQGAKASAGVPGGWSVRTMYEGRRTPMLARMDAQLAQVESVFRRVPALDPPRGFSVVETRSAHQRAPDKMVGGRIVAIVIRHDAGDDGSGEGLPIEIVANDIAVTWEKTDLRDAQGQFYTPATRTTFRGLPVYHDQIFLSRRPVPTTIPVTRARAMRAAIAALPSASAALQRELDAMSDAERQQPAALDVEAWVGYGLGQAVARPLVPSVADTVRNTAREKSVLPLVVPNPAFYDRTRAGDIQALTVRISCTGEQVSPWCAQYPGLFERIRNSVDWEALMARVR